MKRSSPLISSPPKVGDVLESKANSNGYVSVFKITEPSIVAFRKGTWDVLLTFTLSGNGIDIAENQVGWASDLKLNIINKEKE